MAGFLPVTMEELRAQGTEQPDFVYISGDAYVDHPSFGAAIITRILEAHGYTCAMLAQPDWKTDRDFTRFGKPRLAFPVSSGNIDSMVAHYTAAKKKRSDDYYSPGGKAGFRPDRAVIVYCQKLREIYGNEIPILIGGLEASLRRFAHYDYWDDTVKPSVLQESGADLLMFGMGTVPGGFLRQHAGDSQLFLDLRNMILAQLFKCKPGPGAAGGIVQRVAPEMLVPSRSAFDESVVEQGVVIRQLV